MFRFLFIMPAAPFCLHHPIISFARYAAAAIIYYYFRWVTRYWEDLRALLLRLRWLSLRLRCHANMLSHRRLLLRHYYLPFALNAMPLFRRRHYSPSAIIFFIFIDIIYRYWWSHYIHVIIRVTFFLSSRPVTLLSSFPYHIFSSSFTFVFIYWYLLIRHTYDYRRIEYGCPSCLPSSLFSSFITFILLSLVVSLRYFTPRIFSSFLIHIITYILSFT